MAQSPAKPASVPNVHARLKVWLEIDGEYVFGVGISRILRGVRTSGSIKAAAGLLGKSYRHIWSRIKEAERALGEPLVETQVGGTGTNRSTLTDRAERLMNDYDALRQRMLDVAEQEFSSRFALPPEDETGRD